MTDLAIASGSGTLVDNHDGTWSYTPALNDDTQVSFSYQVTDGSTSVPDSATLDITPVNDAPVVAASGGTTAASEQVAVTVDTALTVSDDTATLASASVSITTGFHAGEDVLGFVNQNGITGSYDALSGVLTLSGASSVAHYQAALRSVTYMDTSDTPDTATRSISFQANDGLLNSNVTIQHVAVTAVDDAPVAANGSASGSQDTIVTGTVPVASDVDNTAIQLTYSLVGADGGAAHGTVVLNADGTFDYTPVAGYLGDDSFSFKAGDGQLDSNVANEHLTVADTTPPGAPAVVLAHDTGVSAADNITSNPAITVTPAEAGGTLLYKVDGAAGFTTAAPVFTLDGVHTVAVEQQDAAGNTGAATSLTFTLDTLAPHVSGVTASPTGGNEIAGSTVTFAVAFDEAVKVAGGTPTLSLNDGATVVYDAAATSALHDPTTLAFHYLVSANDPASPSLAVTGVALNGATVSDVAGNSADLTTAATTFSALSINVPSFPAETINGIVRPAIFLDSSNHIILDAAAAASAYGTKFLYAGLPDTVLFPPVADTSHAAADFHLV